MIYINPMENDEQSIKWLNQIVNAKEDNNDYLVLKEAWEILNKYYDECITDLKGLPTDISPFFNKKINKIEIEKLPSSYNTFKNICKNDYIVTDFLSKFDGIYTLDDINNLAKSDKKIADITVEEEWLITKLIRFNNMQVKLAHSARITYIAKYIIDNIIGDISQMDSEQQENINLLRSSVILSALLHDIGRFYQSVHYSSFNDREMERHEKILNVPLMEEDVKKISKPMELSVDHAVAGYYYSLSSALKFQKLAQDKTDDSALKDFILQAISAIVVRFHQKSNKEIENFESNETIDCLEEESLKMDIYNFLCVAYDNAKAKNKVVDNIILKNHKVFIDKFIEKIGMKDFAYEGFKQSEKISDTINILKYKINEILSNFDLKDIDEVSNHIMEIMNEQIQNLAHSDTYLKTNNVTKEEVKELLQSIVDYDIAESIKFYIDKGMCSDMVKYYISTSLLTTMDADKIDILVQRSKGTYPSSYNLSSYEIFPTPYKINGKQPTLRNLLEEYYCYDFDVYSSSGIDFNKTKKIISKVSRILCQFKVNIKKQIFIDIQENFPYELYEKVSNLQDIEILEDEIEIENDSIRINNKKMKNYVDFTFKELKTIFDFIFNKNWYEYMCSIDKINGSDFKSFKESHFYKAQISVSALDLADNLGIAMEQNSSVLKKVDGTPLNTEEQEKIINVYKRLVTSDELANKFILDGENRKNPDWINDLNKEENAHLVGSTFSGLIWQLNQFLFVNMRNINSYKFIRDNKILENIIPTFQKFNSGIMAILLKDYIEYSKYFVYRIIKLYEDGLNDDLIDKYSIKKTTQKKFKTTLVSSDVLDVVRKIVSDEYKFNDVLENDIHKKK